MDDDGPPTPRRKQSSSSSRPSTQRNRPVPRGRRSTQSLTLSRSSSKLEETPTLTSFEPFSSPKHDESDDSHSSSKRSRSYYAPDRQNSVNGEPYTPSIASIASPVPASAKIPSVAAQSLMNTMMDLTGTEDSLFSEHDLQYFRHHPGALASSENKTLRELSKRQSYFSMIRTLAGDLAQRDVEVVSLRRRLEELSKIFKEHLCAEHELSRIEADKTLHNLTMSTRTPAEQSLARSLDFALETPLSDYSLNPLSDGTVENGTKVMTNENKSSPRDAAFPRKPTEVTGPNGTVKGIMSMFGGRNANRSLKPGRRREPLVVSNLNSTKSSLHSRRRSSVGSATSSLPASGAPVGPVEMNAIVETENLPPPLTSQRDIQSQYPGFTADIYGFVIDSNRVKQFQDKHRISSPNLSKGADTPQTSASSVRSFPHSLDEEDEEPSDNLETEASSWTSYLRFDGSTLGSLSWLPIASTTSPSSDEEAFEAPVELGQTEAAKVLQQQLEDDFGRLQRSRTVPWEKLLTQTRSRSDSTSSSLVPAMFRRGTPSPTKTSLPTDTPPQLTNLSAPLRAERARLVLSGIPMTLRSQIYTTIALETLQPDPDLYALYLSASSTTVDPSLRAEIEDDIPRTLPNNVFFRLPSSKGRSALRQLLTSFVARRPEIGYCQGMNLIAGYLLLALPTTEAAFWVFTYLIEHPLSDVYFDATLRGASIEICVLRSYIDELIPRLARKLDECGVEGRESAPYNWFLTGYASALSVEGVYRVWDVLLGLPGVGSAGWMVRFGVALCKAFEEEMLALEGGFEVRGFMDRMGVGGVGTGSGGNVKGKGGKGGVAGRKGVSIDGLIKAAWKLGAAIKDDEVKKRRKYFALKIDESALG